MAEGGIPIRDKTIVVSIGTPHINPSGWLQFDLASPEFHITPRRDDCSSLKLRDGGNRKALSPIIFVTGNRGVPMEIPSWDVTSVPKFYEPRAHASGRQCRPKKRLIRGKEKDISPRLFLSADAGYGTAFQEYCGLARLGYRLRPRLSLGLEGGALGNEEYNTGRGGGFVRMNFRDAEVTLSGGFTGNYLEDVPSGYVALDVYRTF
jgi:hypothetical protein